MTPLEAKRFLDSLGRFGMRFGLERIHGMLEALGRPERRFRVLHVAGTNGKGSTCAFAAAMLRAAGRRVGLYTSPHLVRINERFRVDGQDISDAQLAEGVRALLTAFPTVDDPCNPMTFFEVGTALALWHFAREGVEVAVIETGLGGRLDATNAVQSHVAAITRIGLDHTAILGSTLEAIAAEKAGIFKPAALSVIGRQPEEALEVLVAAAERTGRRPFVAGRDFALDGDGPYRFRADGVELDGLHLALAGPHQRENAEVAIEATRLLEARLGEPSVRAGLATAEWPGRMERADRHPLTLLDGAHNPDGAAALAHAMRVLYPRARVHLVFGMLGDKDVSSVARHLVPLACRLYLASPACERALSVSSLASHIGERAAPSESFASVADALAAARAAVLAEGADSLVLVAGSLYVVGEAKAALERRDLPIVRKA